ncbi:hypothetical protein VNO80_33043 [Phaseolus coccineus]|uniref:Uncharacterized protein n=1 Tax=Phaseolus coccineus TaxID=3886 RepID=A0AAN9KYJ4_PHACN
MSEGAVKRRWLENDHVRVKGAWNRNRRSMTVAWLLERSGGPGFITPTYDESGRNAANFRAQLYRVKKASTRTKCATGKRIIGPLLFYIKAWVFHSGPIGGGTLWANAYKLGLS